MSVQVINPATEEIISEYSFQSAVEIDRAIDASLKAYHSWRLVPLEKRLEFVEKVEHSLLSSRTKLAELMTREMGKPLKDSLSEIDKCVASCKTIRAELPRWHSELIYDRAPGFTVTRVPMGPLLGIMPWNFPLWQVVRFAIPAILCGNSILLKHAPNTWGSAELIGEIFNQAFPESLYINLKIDVDQAGKVIADARVRGVSLTGSRQAGISVGALAGKVLKKAVLELGGSDAYVILDDANVIAAAEVCARSRMLNAGQSCVSAKRFIVTKKNAGEFTAKMHSLLAVRKWGDPMQDGVDFGPLARKDLRAGLHSQVERSVAGGAKLELGGRIPDGKGFFYPASLLTGVRPGNVAFDEELFGPVAAIIVAAHEREAFELANLSRYGLGGAIFSADVKRAKILAISEMESGMTFVNDFVKSDALVPFGGVKDSGLGRELGREGCFEFTNIKTVFVKPS